MSVCTREPCVCVQAAREKSVCTNTPQRESQDGAVCEKSYTGCNCAVLCCCCIVVLVKCWYRCSVGDTSVGKVLVRSWGCSNE